MKTLFCLLVLFFGLAINTYSQDYATVYFYSYKTITTLGQVRKPVFLDNKEIADVRPARYFIVKVTPGKHSFSLKSKRFGGIEMDFEAGKTYYIRLEWQGGAKLTPSGITKVEPESGSYDIKQLKPVDEKNIKDKTIASTKL